MLEENVFLTFGWAQFLASGSRWGSYIQLEFVQQGVYLGYLVG